MVWKIQSLINDCVQLLILSASGGFSLERVNDTQEF